MLYDYGVIVERTITAAEEEIEREKVTPPIPILLLLPPK
jgi:hypothetical protein